MIGPNPDLCGAMASTFFALLLLAMAGAHPLLPEPYSQPTGQQWTYPQPADLRVPDPSSTADSGIAFAGSITDFAVLQKGSDTSAVVYGTLPSDEASAHVEVTVADAEDQDMTYTVTGEVIPLKGAQAGNVTWRAQLKPHPGQGGDV